MYAIGTDLATGDVLIRNYTNRGERDKPTGPTVRATITIHVEETP